ncbi:hypothetical protein [Bdellovibrio bacteriovorus]|uniref:Uncharacterized protein n=1 Tax=Bdellovibrio bacteriovorus TaxID=959 RepID=A0A1Z3N421_BDEBC|nr:hypothetical protein [Bdellovibrio bacteriovorus]ASD62223.1 hypothetical protein B9G79_00905 [Bdellovibrio bacteriovorus]
MKKPVLSLMALLAFSSTSLADVNSYLRELQETEKMIKTTVAIQYTCDKNFGFVTFAKDKFTMNYGNMIHMKKGSYSGKLISSGRTDKQTFTKQEMSALEFMPEYLKGVRSNSNDGLEDVIITMEKEVSSAVDRDNSVIASKELTEEVKMKGRLTHIDHRTGTVEAEDCDLVIHKCEGVMCATRVVLAHYNKAKAFKAITMDGIEHSAVSGK